MDVAACVARRWRNGSHGVLTVGLLPWLQHRAEAQGRRFTGGGSAESKTGFVTLAPLMRFNQRNQLNSYLWEIWLGGQFPQERQLFCLRRSQQF